MKELTTEQKAQRYDEVLNKAKNTIEVNQTVPDIVECVESLFPELKENEESNDEEIRKALLELISTYLRGNENGKIHGVYAKDILAWLEKQGEQKPADKVEPNFRKGDWVVYCNDDVDLITGIEENGYTINKGGYIPFVCASDIRLWTVQDAKDGDVLFTSSTASHETFIFKNIDEKGNAKCYFAYDSEDGFREGKYHFIGRATDCKPATKEQRDLLFQKMKEAGYEWNAEKKELKKIEQNPAWCEEDEKQARQIERIVHNDGCTQKLQKQIADWFKSIKERVQPQKTWKPSDEQMEALDDFIYAKYPNVEKHGAAVKSLYQDLKKLREE